MCRKGRFHSVSAGLTRMPALKAIPLRISSISLLMRNPPQGPLPLRSSGVNPDACPKGFPTAHQFDFAPDAQSATRAASTPFQRG